MTTVLILEGYMTSLLPEGPEVERSVLGDGVRVAHHRFPADVPVEVMAQARAVIVRPGVALTSEHLAQLTDCRAIVSLGAGYDHIDLVESARRGIPVCHVPAYCVEEVADTALAMLLYLQRRIGVHHGRGAAAEWDWTRLKPARRARGRSVGIVGLGRTGTAVALRCRAFGYEIAFYDPYLSPGIEKAQGFERYHDLEPLLNRSDVVTLHTPATAETAGMIDADFLSRMKPDGVLINVARGALLDGLDPIHDALRERSDFRAGLDVLPIEPPEDHPLLDAWRSDADWLAGRFVLMPHAAFYSEESVAELRSTAAEEAARLLRGESPRYPVPSESA